MNFDGTCAICGAKTEISGKSGRYAKWCRQCYADGLVKRYHGGDRAHSEITRPSKLRDSGLRINDQFNELIMPDGRRLTPVPYWAGFPKYFIENDEKQDGGMILKLMERAT